MRKVLIALMLISMSCVGTVTPISALYVTGNGVQFLKNRANMAIALACPDSITADPQKLESCQQMAADNATAQSAVTEAVKFARIAIEAGDKDGTDIAMAALVQALCSVHKIVPGVVIEGLDTGSCQ